MASLSSASISTCRPRILLQNSKMRNASRLVRSLGFSSLSAQNSFLPSIPDCPSIYEYISNPTSVPLSTALRHYINGGHPFHGLKIHTHILKTGFHPNTNIAIKLLLIHLKCGFLDYARQVFDEMSEPTRSAYNYLMDGYVKQGRFEEVFDLVRGMNDCHEMPDGFTYSLILKAWVHGKMVKYDMKNDVILFGSLLNAYVKCMRVDYARLLFDTMSINNVMCSTTLIAGYMNRGCVQDAEHIFENTVDKDVVVFNAMIEGYSKSVETANKSVEIYIDMKRLDFHPTISTFASLIGACSLLTAVEIGQQVQCHLMKMEFLIDIKISSALIDMYSKCGRVDEAQKIFNQMPETNVFSWTSMIDGYGKNGKPYKALKLFHTMRKANRITPNHITFLSILSSCAHNGLLNEGKEIFRAMERDYSLRPKMEHYACMVDLLGRHGSVVQAWDFIKGMPEKPNSDVWAALLSSCRLHGEVEIANLAAMELLKLGGDERPGAYLSLSNTLAAAGEWNGVIQVRESMKNRRVSKDTTGFTCIRNEQNLRNMQFSNGISRLYVIEDRNT
ncbi:hypothetical protein V2J09_008136 [Rumex salicifolius]